jgi:hypothetical protein
LIDQAVEAAWGLAPERQDEIAHMMLFYADAPVIQLTPEEDADLAAAIARASRWWRTAPPPRPRGTAPSPC